MTETKPTQPTADSSQDDQPFGKKGILTRIEIEAYLIQIDKLKIKMRALGEVLKDNATTDKERDASYWLRECSLDSAERILREAYFDAPID
jgi:hypothetical protein